MLHAFWKVCFHPGVRLDIAGNVRVYPYAGDKYHYYYMKWNYILSFIVFASQYRILRVYYNILIDCEHVKFTYMNCELWCEVVVKLKPEKTSGLYWSTYLCDTGAVLS